MRSFRPSRSLPLLAAVVGLGLTLAACGSGVVAGSGGSTPVSNKRPSSSGSSAATTTRPTPTTVPGGAIVQPTAAHPLTILEVGDSLGLDLGFGLADVLGSDPYVRVLQKAVGDTGLANEPYFNWPVEFESDLHKYHPGAVIIFLGGNDGQNFWYGSEYASFGNAVWHVGYSARVAQMMSEATAAGARVLWVGLPIMQDPSFWQEMEMENAIYQAEAASHPGVTYYASWPVFANSAGQYISTITEPDGEVALLRDPDGVHLATAGWDRLANALVAPMEKAWSIKLFPASS
jgi:hypothetical protein